MAAGTARGLPVVCPACWSLRPACPCLTLPGACSPRLQPRGRPRNQEPSAVPPSRLPLSWSTGPRPAVPRPDGSGSRWHRPDAAPGAVPAGRHLRGGLARSRREEMTLASMRGRADTCLSRGWRSRPVTP